MLVTIRLKPRLFVIDDHQEARESLQALLSAHGYDVQIFADAETFFNHYPQHDHSCVITDLKMMGMDGLEVVRKIKLQQVVFPVIVVSAFATVAEAVQIMKAGADTLIQKPYSDIEILEAVEEALNRTPATVDDDLTKRFQTLTDEEMLVLEKVIAGQPTKAIAYSMGVSSRTVDRRRLSIFEKLEAKSLAELAMMYVEWSRDQGHIPASN